MPRLLAGGIVMLASFLVPGGAANNGWTSYAPLSDLAPGHGQTMWLVGMLLIILSSLLGAMNFIATIVQLRAPALQAAAILQGMDRLAGTSFFLPSGLVVGGQVLEVAWRARPLVNLDRGRRPRRGSDPSRVLFDPVLDQERRRGAAAGE